MANLKLDFYESGKGDTIVITFPDDSMGLVDAHPSPTQSRPDILQIVAGRRLRFVCLTHPHTDHAADLVPVLERHDQIDAFWHTNSEIAPFIYSLGEMPNWHSEVGKFARQMGEAFADVFIDLYFAATNRPNTPIHQIRAGERHEFAGVVIHALSPEEVIQQEVAKFWNARAANPATEPPNPNHLSAVLALRWGDAVVLLGADALIKNWHTAVPRYQALNLPRAILLKVPHHGASNAFTMTSTARRPNYLDVCQTADRECVSVLFAGDSKHPDKKVYDRLVSRTEVHCLINGIGRGRRQGIDLGIELSGARPVQTIDPCHPVLSFEVYPNATVKATAGGGCAVCPLAPQ